MSWMSAPGVAAVAQTLVHSLWEGAGVALGLAVFFCFARTARVRYAGACLAMVVLLGGLVATFTRLAPASSVRFEGITTRIAPGAFGHPVRTFAPGSAPEKPQTNYATWAVSLWVSGVLVFYLRGIASWMAAWRLRRTGVCRATEFWRIRMEVLQSRLKFSRAVVLMESSLAEVPVVIGYLRPVILLPVGLLAGMPVSQVESILLHELAHIRRYDYAVNLLQIFVEGLLFYHPAVWWISGVMRTEREYCCDDLVVGATGGALEYATALTALERRRAEGAVLAATGGDLVKRVERLLGRRKRQYAPALPVFTAAMLTVTAVVATMAFQRSVEPLPVTSVKPVAEALPPMAQSNQASPVRGEQKDTSVAPRPITRPEAPVVRHVRVLGAVQTPGPFDIAGPITLIDAMAKAGWTTPEAGPELMLRTAGSDAPRKINIKQLQSGEDEALNVVLTGGELVTVPNAPKVWVTGNVTQPQGVSIRNPNDATVLKVVASVDGLTQYYSKTAYIYRVDETGRRQEIPVALSDIMHRRVPDVMLQPDDILLIPDEIGTGRGPGSTPPLFMDPPPRKVPVLNPGGTK